MKTLLFPVRGSYDIRARTRFVLCSIHRTTPPRRTAQPNGRVDPDHSGRGEGDEGEPLFWRSRRGKKSSIESQYAMNIYPPRRVLLLLLNLLLVFLELLLLLNLLLLGVVLIVVCSAAAAVFCTDVAVFLLKKLRWLCTCKYCFFQKKKK